MSRISDLIEKFISDMIEESKGVVEIQRNEMANYFDCAPSQINYVPVSYTHLTLPTIYSV